MKLKKSTSSNNHNRALITCIVKVLISYFIILFFKFLSNILLNIMVKNDTSEHNIKIPSNKKNGYLVGWLSTLAQHHPRIIKTDDVYAKYSEDESVGLNFYLIKTSIEDKNNLCTDSEESHNNVAFYVRIHKMAYTDTPYNRIFNKVKNFIYSIKNKRPWRKLFPLKTKESVRHLKESEYEVTRYRAIKNKWFQKIFPSLRYIDNSILLRLELLESLPCGICQFEITPLRLKEDDFSQIDMPLWKCIFDEIHQFFHEHHFPPAKSLSANLPIYYDTHSEILTFNNINIRYYIESIGNFLTNQLDEIYRSYQNLLVSNKVKREKGQRKIKDKKLRESAMSFFENCDNLLGIHAFLSTVINSPQNTRIVLNREIHNIEDINDREIALRIESAYKGTIALMQKISHHHDFRNNHKSIQKAKIGIYWSIGLGVAGLILSLVLAYERWHECIETYLEKFDKWILSFF